MMPKTRWDRLAAGSWFKIRTADCRPIPIQSRILQPVFRRGNLRWSHDGGRMRDRSISLVELNQLRLWIEPKPEVTECNRYGDFSSSMICGHSSYPRTLLLRGPDATGEAPRRDDFPIAATWDRGRCCVSRRNVVRASRPVAAEPPINDWARAAWYSQ